MESDPEITLLAVTIDARPRPDSPEFATYAGAIVVTYVDSAEEDDAVSRATRSMREQGWEPVSVDAVTSVQRIDVDSNDVALECFDRAVETGLAAVFFGYPHGPGEDAASH